MRTDDTILTLTACKYNDLAKHSKVVNVDELEYYLWVYLNPEQVREAYFLGGEEFSEEDPMHIFPDTFTRPSTSWIRIKSSDLNLSTGLHIYKFSFVDVVTNDTFSLYANYIVQREDVPKPYIYMKREETNKDSER